MAKFEISWIGGVVGTAKVIHAAAFDVNEVTGDVLFTDHGERPVAVLKLGNGMVVQKTEE